MNEKTLNQTLSFYNTFKDSIPYGSHHVELHSKGLFNVAKDNDSISVHAFYHSLYLSFVNNVTFTQDKVNVSHYRRECDDESEGEHGFLVNKKVYLEITFKDGKAQISGFARDFPYSERPAPFGELNKAAFDENKYPKRALTSEDEGDALSFVTQYMSTLERESLKKNTVQEQEPSALRSNNLFSPDLKIVKKADVADVLAAELKLGL